MFNDRIISPLNRRIDPMSARRKVLVLLLIGFLLYGGFIALDNLVLRGWITDVSGQPVDLEYYRNRTSHILEGQIPYKDFQTESPPLIMYLMVPPQIFGGEMWMYQVYFSAYAVLTGLLFYLGLRRFDEKGAFWCGIAYMMMPYALIEFTFGIQDDSISFLFFFLPLALLMLERMRLSGFASSIGLWTKLFNGLLMPWMLLVKREKKKTWDLFLGMVVPGIAIVLPFLILYPDQFLAFPSYYFLQNSSAQTGGSGISPWHFLDRGGLTLPGTIGLIMTIGSLVGSTYLAYRWKLTFWQGSMLIVFAFFIFYPKISFVYFLMPLGLMLPYAVKDSKVMWRLILMSIPLFLAVPFSENGPTPVLDYSWGWMVGFALSMVAWCIFASAFLLTWKKRTFLDEGTS